jgi:hypothetical protein
MEGPRAHLCLLVDPRGFEPLTFWLPASIGQTLCSPGEMQVGDERNGRCYPLRRRLSPWTPGELEAGPDSAVDALSGGDVMTFDSGGPHRVPMCRPSP